MRTLSAKALWAALLVCCAGANPAPAGNMDTHLTTTYLIALRLGYDDADAQRIAAGNWSMDLNANTEALPHPFTKTGNYWFDRGAAYHTLGSPQANYDRLNAMRDALQNSSSSRDDKLAQLGEYLHATQDAYFHQDNNGVPYGPKLGHALAGHDTDRVGAHFDAALRANEATYDILKQYKEIGGTLTAVPAPDIIYTKNTDPQLQQIKDNDKTTGVYTLTDAVARSYDSMTLTQPLTPVTPQLHRDPTKDYQATYFADPTPDELKSNLAVAWKKITGGQDLNLPGQMLTMDLSTKGAIDYTKNANVLLGTGTPPSGSTITGLNAAPTPGGISLSMAAARRLALKLDLDGIVANDGRLVLSGRSGGGQHVDAALFHTAVRLACEPDDPFFSLDPDDGKAWSEEGQRASDAIWPRIRADHGLDDPLKKNPVPGLAVRALSAKRDYGQLWRTLAPQFPNLKTRLVFRPEWLRYTRFGEILYKADVLLKELDGGVPTLRADAKLRAGKVDRFASAAGRSAAESLLEIIDKGAKTGGKPQFRGSRLWFDLAPGVNDHPPGVALLDGVARKTPSPAPAVFRSTNPAAQQVAVALSSRGYVGTPRAVEPSRTLAVDGDAVDLSQVYPRMFVRAHDHASGKDIPGSNPSLNALSDDVNGRIRQYVEAYDELRALTDVFRMYVAAVAFTKRDARVCDGVRAMPLLASEKLRSPLPEFHPTEIYFVFATYVQASAGGQKRWWFGSSTSYDGGVSPHGKEFFERESIIPQQTTITSEVRREAAATGDKPVWRSTSGREFVALVPDTDAEFIRQARELQAFKPVTRQMVAASLRIGGTGMLDDPGVAAPKSGGMLDDVDATRPGVVVIPGSH